MATGRDGGKQEGASRPPPFRPRFTLGLLYIGVFFFFFSFLQILPGLVEILTSLPPGPEQEREAARMAEHSVSPLLSLGLALAATWLGHRYRVLPGMRAD